MTQNKFKTVKIVCLFKLFSYFCTALSQKRGRLMCITNFYGCLRTSLLTNRKYLPMAKKVTSSKVASQASQALRDGRSSSRTKSIAGSALSQREKTKKSK